MRSNAGKLVNWAQYSPNFALKHFITAAKYCQVKRSTAGDVPFAVFFTVKVCPPYADVYQYQFVLFRYGAYAYIFVSAHSGTCRNKFSYYHVFLQAYQRVHLALDGGFRQDPCCLLEGCGRQE